MKFYTQIKKHTNKIRHISYNSGNCNNCHEALEGKFCSNCGQSAKKLRFGIISIIHDALEGMFAFDSKLTNTLKPLILRPGFLTSEFIKGRRVRYTPPFKMFLFASFIAFLLIGRNHTPEINSENKDLDKIAEDIKLEINSKDISPKAKKNNIDIDVKFDDYEKEENDTEEQETLIAIKKLINTYKLNPSIITDSFFKNISHSIFIILPIFAIILAIFFFNYKLFFLEHLLNSLYFHIFILIIIIFFELSSYIPLEIIGNNNDIIFICIPIYLLFLLKNTYKNSWVKTSIKFIFIGIIHISLLLSSLFFSLAKLL